MTLRTGILFILLGLTLACSRQPDKSRPHVMLAEQFAHALVDGKYDEAHRLLTDDLQPRLTAAALKKEYEAMLTYAPGPTNHVEAMQTLDSWPKKLKGDIGWVYVAIAGDSFSEAVSVVVAQQGTQQRIRLVEWGRP